MSQIKRGSGTTPSERVLAKFAEKTFLDLWSYPNTYNDRDLGKGQGKELCDLLVVCGRDVLIFSDKEIQWPPIDDLNLAWRRWLKRAVFHSGDQLRGAERWIRQHPNRIFIDPECKIALPVDLPSEDDIRIHRVAVVTGCKAACKRVLKGSDGSLRITGSLVGRAHLDEGNPPPPFMVGDVDPDGGFIHVFDERALTIVMRELDTITDFIEYLIEREGALRSNRVGIAASEAELVAAYLLTCDPDGKHFIPSGHDDDGRVAPLHFPPGGYQALTNHRQYRAKKSADRQSRGWDALLRSFTKNLLAGTSVTVAGHKPEIATAERAARAMALENRVNRRALSSAFAGAFREAIRQNQDRYARIIMPHPGSADPDCAYVLLILADRGIVGEKGYEHYREVRAGFLKAYCQATLYRFREVKTVVGIALDAPRQLTGKRGGSEDLLMMESPEWTPELIAETERLMEGANLLQPDRLRSSGLHLDEFPEPSVLGSRNKNRKARRAARSRRS